MVKKIKKIALYCFILLVLLLGGAFGFVSIYEDDVKAFAIEKISESLITQVNVENVELSVFDRFPSASLEFKDVLIEETFESHDTLLAANKLFLEFDVFNIIRGKYTVEEVAIENAKVFLKRDQEGNDNFHFWKKGEGESDDFSFSLEKVQIKDSHLIFDDKKSEFVLDLFADNISLKGEFGKDILELNAKSDFKLKEITVGKDNYASQKHIKADFQFTINAGEEVYTLNRGDFNIEGLDIMADGTFTDAEKGTNIELDLSSEHIDIEDLITHLPEKYYKDIAAYRSKGDLSFTGQLSGMAGNKHVPNVMLNFNVKNGKFAHFESGVAMSDINTQGSFEKEDGGPEKLRIKNLKADFESGSFTLSGVLAEFAHPWIDLTIAGNFNLNDILKFAEIESLETLDGRFNIDAAFEGKIQDLKNITGPEMRRAKTSGRVEFSDASFKIKDAPHTFENLKGSFGLKDQDAEIKSLSGTVMNSDFDLNGRFKNFLPYVFVDGERLSVVASGKSKLMNFTELLSNSESSNESDYHLEFPALIDFQLDINVDHLTFRQFEAKSLRGRASLVNQNFNIDPLSFQTAGGNFVASANAVQKNKENIEFNCTSHFVDINITELFYQFENFGQEFITMDNLEGTASADVTFNARMSSALKFNPDDIHSLIDIKVEDGQLIELKSMHSISEFIHGHALLSTLVNKERFDEKLHHIYFSTLENQIEVKDGEILIPTMAISSSAMDISVSGKHSFDNEIDYSLGFKIRDVLSKSNDSEFGTVEDDGLGNSLFLSMEGNTSDPDFSYDRLAHKQLRKENRQKEKEEFKGLFKGDTSIFKKKDQAIEEDDSTITLTVSHEDKPVDPKPKEKKKRDKKKFLEDDEDEEEVIIVIEGDEEDF